MSKTLLPTTLCLVSLACSAGCTSPPNSAHPTATTSAVACRPADRVFPLLVRPDRMLVHAGRLYISSFYDKQLCVLDAHTGRQLKKFDTFDYVVARRDEAGQGLSQPTEATRSAPGSIAIAGDRLFVTQPFADSLLVLDAANLSVLGRIKVGRAEGALAVAPDAGTVYFASNVAREFLTIDARTLVTRAIPYPAGSYGIGSVVVSPDGRRLFLALQCGAREAGAAPPSPAAGPVNPLAGTCAGPLLAVYDLAGEKYGAVASIGDTLAERGDDSSGPSAMALDEAGRYLYIAMGQCMVGVHVYDTVTNELCRPITFASRDRHFAWPGCTGVAVRGNRLFVTVGCNRELAIVDLDTRRCMAIVPLGAGDDLPGPIALCDRQLLIGYSELRRIFVVDAIAND